MLSKEDLLKRAKDAGYTFRGSFEVSKALVISDPLFTLTDPFEEESKNHLSMCHPGRWHIFTKDVIPQNNFSSNLAVNTSVNPSLSIDTPESDKDAFSVLIVCHDAKIRELDALVAKLKPCGEILISSKSIAFLDSVLSKDEDFIEDLTESELNKTVQDSTNQDKAYVCGVNKNGWFEVSCDNFGQKNSMLAITIYEAKLNEFLN